MSRSVKVCITCSPGGHYAEAMRATAHLASVRKYYVTFYRPTFDKLRDREVFYFLTHPQRKVIPAIKNLIESFQVLRKERPDLIISTGADVTVGTVILGRLLFGAKVIYIESGGNPIKPTLTGRICYPFADLFIVQWEPMTKKFKKAICGGPLF